MRKGLILSSALGLALVGVSGNAQSQSSADRNNDDSWDGPGFYAEDLATILKDGSRLLIKTGGPFSSSDACQSYLKQQQHTPVEGVSDSYQCVYRGSFVKYDEASCFLTTACVSHAGLADDCEELTIMRAFRDRYLRGFDEGRQLIEQYYKIAPRIVRAIHASHDHDRVLEWVLRQVHATSHAIGRGESELAIGRYAAMVARLQQRYAIA